MDKTRLILLLALAAASLTATAAWAGSTVTISPGAVDRFSRLEARCPLFSWGGVERAARYELAVWAVDSSAELEVTEPIVRREIHGAALSWTPSLADCPPRGGRYAWSLRALAGGEAGEWSEPRLFEIVAKPSTATFDAALALLSRYAKASAPGSSTTSGAAGEAVPPAPRAVATPSFPAGALPTAETVGLAARDSSISGRTFGLHGISDSSTSGSAGLVGESTASSGQVIGVIGRSAGAAGAAFVSTGGGPILRGISNGTVVLDVSSIGTLTAAAFAGDGQLLTNVPDLDCPGCVIAGHVGTEQVTGTKIAAASVNGSHLATNSVTSAKIAAGAVSSSEIVAGAVTNQTIGGGAVTRPDVEGTERKLYELHHDCRDGFNEDPSLEPTLEIRCLSGICDRLPPVAFWNCNGVCSEPSAVWCDNPVKGYLLDPNGSL